MNAAVLIHFCNRLVKETDSGAFLVVDNLELPHVRRVKQWPEKHVEQIEVFYLLSYNPEFSPDEYLNVKFTRSGLQTVRAMNSCLSCRYHFAFELSLLYDILYD